MAPSRRARGAARRLRAATSPRTVASRTAVPLTAVALLAGCASAGPDIAAAADVAEAFHAAVTVGDGAAACDLLAPAAVEQLEQDAAAPCPEAVLGADLPRASAVEEAQAYGRQAQVRLSDDVVFLTVSGGDWLVTAAGCTPRPERPYDCRIAEG